MSFIEWTAKKKVTAPLGDAEFHVNEKVLKVEPFVVDFGFDETWYLLFTESDGPFGYTKNGRIIIADSENSTRDFAGGIFWINEGNIKKIQSVYLDPEFRKGLVMPKLVKIARANGINMITGPFSTAGQSFADRYKFKVDND